MAANPNIIVAEKEKKNFNFFAARMFYSQVFQAAYYGAGAVTMWTFAFLLHQETKVLEAKAKRLRDMNKDSKGI